MVFYEALAVSHLPINSEVGFILAYFLLSCQPFNLLLKRSTDPAEPCRLTRYGFLLLIVLRFLIVRTVYKVRTQNSSNMENFEFK